MRREVVPRLAASLAILGLCSFAAVSVLTFDRGDLAAYTLPVASPVRNGAGVLGAHLGAFLLEGLGICAGLLIALVAAWAVLNLLGRGLEQLGVRALGAILLLACACTLANTTRHPPAAMPGYGGAVGVALGTLLVQYFGSTGQWLLGAGLTAMALLMLSVDELLVPPIAWAGRAGKNRLAWLLKPRRPRDRVARTRPTTIAVPVAKADLAALQEADTAVVGEEPQSGDVTETAETQAEPVDTGRPVTVGYLDHIVQEVEPGTSQAADDETPTEDSEEEPVPARRAERHAETYLLPPPSLLDEPSLIDKSLRSQHRQDQIEVLERTLKEFGVGARVVHIDEGPVVTRYELALDAGTKLTKVTSLSDDLAIATRAPAVRIVAPIPGKSTVGVELPNTEKEFVYAREIIESDAYRNKNYTLPLLLAKDASGKPIVGDLTRMPHLLIAGATGSGKSVCINSIIVSILMTQHPDDVRLILIDPKVVELAAYAEIPHLLTPVVTDMKRAAWILDWACRTMDERYDTLAAVGVRSIAAYNALGEEEIRRRIGEDADYERIPFHIPYIVIIVDELADMMMLAAKSIETSITRLAQKSRAVGLHIILATQRPSVDVITGLIKSNLPTRISFQVTSKVDSRTILDRNGAEKLLGCGDMLFLPPGSSNLIRAQGTYISDDEVRRIVEFTRRQRHPDFSLNLDGYYGDGDDEGAAGGLDGYTSDDLYEDACRVVLASGRGSVSLLQRKLEIGYTRAARLIDMMAAEGIVGDYKGSKAREVVTTVEQWEAKRGSSSPRVATTVDEHFEKLDDAAEDDVDEEEE